MTIQDSSRRSSQRKRERGISRKSAPRILRRKKRLMLDESEDDAMDEFDVPDICLGGLSK